MSLQAALFPSRGRAGSRALAACSVLVLLPQALAAQPLDNLLRDLRGQGEKSEASEPLRPEDYPVPLRRGAYATDVYGFRLGSFSLTPLLAAGVTYDSNIFATRRDRVADTVFSVAPRLRFGSDWARHGLELETGLVHRRYARTASESTTDAEARLRGWLDIGGDAKLSLSGAAGRLHEPREAMDAPGALARPLGYTFYEVHAVLQKRFNDVGLWLSGRSVRFVYDDAVLRNGTRVPSTGRDLVVHELGAGLAYSVSATTAVFGEILANRRDHLRHGRPDSHGYRALAGIDLSAGGMLRARLGAGYFEQRYSGGTSGRVGGAAYLAAVDWSPSPLWTISINGERRVADTVYGTSAGRVDTGLGATIYYEIARGIVLRAGADYWRQDYIANPRRDEVKTLRGGADYYFHRRVSLGIDYSHTIRKSNFSIYDYSRTFVGLNAQAKF